MDLQGKKALITGSAVRIGRAIALALADEGCELFLHYYASQSQVEELVTLLNSQKIPAHPIRADLRDESQIQMIFPTILGMTTHIDILVNNAGLFHSGTGLKTTPKSWDEQFMVNLRAPFLLSRAFARQLPQNTTGRIVNISDARVARAKNDHFAYRLTKSALNEMTRMLAVELAPHITVNAVAPGMILPLAGREEMDLGQLIQDRIPLKHSGSVESVASAVVHLLKQDFMTGQVVNLDGGEYL